MEKVKITQNTPEWLELRKTKIGSSDANIIMGKSRFSSPYLLWLDKTNQEIPEQHQKKDESTYIQDRGHAFEEKYRNLLEIEYGGDFPSTTIISENYPHLMASLDGFCEEKNLIAEFKLCGMEKLEMVKSGVMIDEYIPQVQFQLALSNADYCVFYVYADVWALNEETGKKEKTGEVKTASMLVYPDKNYIEKELMPAINKFYFTNIKENQAPGYNHFDIVEIDENKKLETALTRYRNGLKKEKQGKEQKTKASKAIFGMVRGGKSIYKGSKITANLGDPSFKPDYEAYAKSLATDEEIIEAGFYKYTPAKINKKITLAKI